MQSAQRNHLVRKQYLVSDGQVRKLQRIAAEKGTSVTEIVRRAIDAFDPDRLDDMEQSELLELVSARLKEAVIDTQRTRKRLEKTLLKLEHK